MSPRTRRVFVLIALSAATVALWHTPLLLPFKVLVVFIHEMCHALGSLLTGGHVEELVVRPDQSGYTKSSGGWFFVVASAGYVGSAMVGGLLLLSTKRRAMHATALAVLGTTMLTMTVLYVPVTNLFGFMFGLAGAVVMLLAVVKEFRYLELLISFLAVMCCLYAVYDLSDFLLHDALPTDAGILARHIGLEALAVPIGVVWSLISLAILWVSARRAF